MERLKGIEPSSSDWKSEALPLSYSRVALVADSSSGPLTRRYARIGRWRRSQGAGGDQSGPSASNPTGDPHRFR